MMPYIFFALPMPDARAAAGAPRYMMPVFISRYAIAAMLRAADALLLLPPASV